MTRQRIKEKQDRFYEQIKDQRKMADAYRDKSTQEYDTPFDGPRGVSAKIAKDQFYRSKKIPVTLPKMSWEKMK